MKLERKIEIQKTSKVRAALMEERTECINIAIMHAESARQNTHDLTTALIRADFGITPLDAIDSLARLQVALGRVRALTLAIEMIDLAGLE